MRHMLLNCNSLVLLPHILCKHDSKYQTRHNTFVTSKSATKQLRHKNLFDVIKAETGQNGLSLTQRKIEVSLNLAHAVTPFLLNEGAILIHSSVYDSDIFQ